MSTVLVTGGTGFLAGWTIRKLIEQGHAVRATVRKEGKGDVVVKMLAAEGVSTENLSFVVADLGSKAGWAEAVAGADYVLHTASPLGGEDHNDPSLISTAKAGALHVVDAAIAAGVKKIVMTSSAAAVFPGRADTRQNIDETYWTDMDDRLVTNYMRSKVVAEKAAWEAVAQQSKTKLTTILPGAIFGPFMDGRNSSTDLLFTTILRGTPSPKATYQAVDVRDLADLHIRAMTDDRADGERFLAQPGEITMPQMARLLKDRLGERGNRISTMTIPDFVIRVGARFNSAIAVMNTLIGMKHRHDATKAQRLLGWEPRSAEDTVIDTAEYVLVNGLVK
jgi:nucleoside-diphosphate-sugar epimerase